VAISGGEFADPFGLETAQELERLKAQSSLIKNLLLQSANLNAQTQIQQLQQDITNKVDVLVVFELTPRFCRRRPRPESQ